MPIDVDYDVAVLGGGAAGLIAAARAAELGARVVLLEKNRRAGVKILISGGTRCNITNARGLRRLEVVTGPVDPAFDPGLCRGAREIQRAFGPGGSFLAPSLRRLDVDTTVRLFEVSGVRTRIEANGKIFPASDRAVDVLAALVARLGRSGAEFRPLCPVTGVEPSGPSTGPGFVVRVPNGVLTASRVILTAGGLSYPGCGTTGDGYAIARALGHAIVEPRPALVPIRVGADWVADLRGIALPDASASIHDPDGKLLQSRREAVLFAHFGLSGPAILDISRCVARADDPARLTLRLDLLPGAARDELDRAIQAASRQGRRPVATLLPESLPRRLAECVVAAADVPADRMGPDLSRDERHRLVAALKGLPLPVRGTLGFEKAEVTSGGVALEEVNPATLESRLVPGLYLAGEVLDLDGLIGGYNFQAAWSTGWLAGETAAQAAREA
ncbi:MAG: BaiN/RdsA family NAD(P)/FAD-dependent oxidoreductase [Isosphaeraceae bacterium]